MTFNIVPTYVAYGICIYICTHRVLGTNVLWMCILMIYCVSKYGIKRKKSINNVYYGNYLNTPHEFEVIQCVENKIEKKNDIKIVLMAISTSIIITIIYILYIFINYLLRTLCTVYGRL